MDHEGTARLLSAILTDLPKLDGAACQGRYELFDELPGRPSPDERRERLQAAATVCRACP
ncbi:MAG: hypothetical protein ACRDSF_21780 [Pseudonocardiaceae bacterium]